MIQLGAVCHDWFAWKRPTALKMFTSTNAGVDSDINFDPEMLIMGYVFTRYSETGYNCPFSGALSLRKIRPSLGRPVEKRFENTPFSQPPGRPRY
jgi:hypothetical protein